jgi:hypothetical protein
MIVIYEKRLQHMYIGDIQGGFINNKMKNIIDIQQWNCNLLPTTLLQMYNDSKVVLSSTYCPKSFNNPTREETIGVPPTTLVFFFFSLNQCDFPYNTNHELSTFKMSITYKRLSFHLQAPPSLIGPNFPHCQLWLFPMVLLHPS